MAESNTTPAPKVYLAKRLASARNYLYEATMMDYSMASINRGIRDLQDVLRLIEEAGLNPDDLVEETEWGYRAKDFGRD